MLDRRLSLPLVVLMLLAASVDAAFSQETTKKGKGEEIRLGGTRIVGGVRTEISHHPWQVAFRASGYLCGGSLIAPRWIVTAAHCLRNATGPSEVTVKIGATNLKTQGSWIPIRDFKIHEEYNRATHANDIALIQLNNTSRQRSIPLMDPGSALVVGQPLEITGWGATAEGGIASAELLKATVPYVAREDCNGPDSYDGRILRGMMCAGYAGGGTDTCQGDSGGPLVWRRSPDEPVLVGVVSFGLGCARKLKYGVYARVADYRAWIDRVATAVQ